MNTRLKHGTCVSTVMIAIRQRISGRSLTAGDKLPSVRAFATTMHVSVSTVVNAYDRLVAEGIITSRRGSGFYVADQIAPLELSQVTPKLDRAIDPLWISRQSLDAASDDLKPGCGWLPPSWLPENGIRQALRHISRTSGTTLTDYGPPLGLPALRQVIARRLADNAINAPIHQIMLTDSGTQSIDLLCRLLLQPGDTVLIDDPCYFNFSALLRAHHTNQISVPYTPTGPNIEQLESILVTHKPKLYITNSAIHNPTGAILSPTNAHKVLKLADAFGLTIIEDDIFGDFEHTPAARLASFDGLDRVIHIGSFSKTLSASIRCGFIAARADWIEALIDLKIATSFGGSQLNPQLVLSVLTNGSYKKHLTALRLRLSSAMFEVNRRLKSIGIQPWHEPQAGMFLWSRLPHNIDATELARDALLSNIILAPGNAFSLSKTSTDFLRFNVSHCQDDAIFNFLSNAISNRS